MIQGWCMGMFVRAGARQMHISACGVLCRVVPGLQNHARAPATRVSVVACERGIRQGLGFLVGCKDEEGPAASRQEKRGPKIIYCPRRKVLEAKQLIQGWAPACLYACIHSPMHARTHAQSHTHKHTNTQTHAHCTHACTHPCRE